MVIAYERVSTSGQTTLRQDVMMENCRVEKVFSEKISGKNSDRPQLKEMIGFVREGDVVVVESISRLARNTRDFLNILHDLDEKKVKFVSLKENIDTSTATGRFMLQVFASLAELEREQILTRQAEGIAAAKAAGTYHPGRPRVQVDEKKFKDVVTKWKAGEITAVEAMKKLDMSKATFYRMVKK